MQVDITKILLQAEEHYLDGQEVEVFKSNTASLTKRLETYKYLRDQEIEIFQPIAAELSRVYPGENPQMLEKALKHWLSIMRYCAMAMLLNNSEYLHRSILDWLSEMVQAYEMQTIESTIYDSLLSRLKKSLPADQFSLIQTFLEQSHAELLSGKILNTVGN